MEIATVNEKGQITIPEDPIQELVGLGKKLPGVEEIEAEADVE